MFDYVIVGAGFAGSVVAERIATKLNKSVLIIEKRNHIGGNCFDERNEYNILIHRYGPHIFHTNNKELVDYLSNFTSFDIYFHKVMGMVDGVEIPIPFNLNGLYKIFPYSFALELEKKLISHFGFGKKVPILELKNHKDKDLKLLSNFIYKNIFLFYTQKQWGLSPEDIDKSVTSRVPVVINRDDRYFDDKYQFIPSHGYTHIFKNMLKNKNISLMLNTDYKKILNISKEKITLFNNNFYGKVIFTAQIDELFNYKFGELSYRSIKTEFETFDKDYFQKVSVINYPYNYDFTRITEFKHIHKNNLNKTTILKEYPQRYIIGKNIPYYPLFTKKEQERYNKYYKYSKKVNNLILLGRLAEYKYYDMDDIIERALYIFKTRIEDA